MLKYNFVKNFYLFKSSLSLKNKGKKNIKSTLIKKIKGTINNRVNVNLNGDNLYKIQL